MNLDIFRSINGLAGGNSLLDTVMIFCADYLIYVLAIVALAVAALLLYKKSWRSLILVLITCLSGLIIAEILGLVFPEPRPFVSHVVNQLVSHVPDQSFPSTHTTIAMTTSLAVLCFTRFRAVGVAMVVASIVIGFSRIFAGVHYPIDVAGGTLVGAMSAWLVYGMSKFVTVTEDTSEDIEET